MAQVQLRDYQQDMISGLRAQLKDHRRVLLQAPTGSGKTVLASYIAAETAGRGKLVAFCCHREELINGTSNTFEKYGIPHGFVAASRPASNAAVNVCSIDTLKNRLAVIPQPNIALWDEAHHLGAEGWRAIMDAWPNAYHIGLSATPWRLDGSGLDDCFDALVPGPSTAWLIEQGHLSSFEIFAPNPPSMRGARRGSDYSKADASARMDIPKRTGDIIKHWRLHADGMRTIGFAVNVADSMMIVERFNAAGIKAAHLDGKTPAGKRKQIIRDFAGGIIKVLFNVALFDEGFDLAAIAGVEDLTVDCLIDAAPTMSLSRVLQRWGRVLRRKPYPAIILDHAGNSARHGFPDDDREWTLAGREKGKAANDNGPPPPVTCTGCFRQIKRPLPECCPSCKKRLLAEIKAIEAADGDLRKITADEKAALRSARKAEEHNAKTLAELTSLAQRRGYPSPQAWAFRKWSNSPWRKELAKKSIAQAEV
jgi:superfamily II DNA or RNA helicase